MEVFMKDILLTIIIGLCAGIIDILPMIKMKQDKNSIASAFLVYFIAPFMIYSSSLFHMAWWLKGFVITFFFALPVMLLVIKTEKKALPAIITMTVILGTLIGVTGHFLNISL